MATVGEGVERSRAEHIHLLQHLGAQERVQVLPPRTWALGGGVVVLHRSKEEKQPRSWIRERKGFVRKPRKGGFVDERTRSLSGRTGIYTVSPQDLGCTPAAGQPTEFRVVRPGFNKFKSNTDVVCLRTSHIPPDVVNFVHVLVELTVMIILNQW